MGRLNRFGSYTQTTRQLVTLDDLELDGGTQPREAMDEALIQEYSERMSVDDRGFVVDPEGVDWQKLTVFEDDDGQRWLADGFHRTMAAKLAGITHDKFAFDRHDAASLLEKLETPRVDLPSGAWLSVERTAALVAIDVNSGASKDDALTIDLEAAREIARQIRLRDLAGLIAVDILRVVKPGERARLLDAFKHATRYDRRRVDVLGITAGGLVEMTRARSQGRAGE